ncbi:MAG: hypothetical protein JXB50_10080 [Spirochaetes bacterium]|nr:hypothetical protein [Spirochaetota bacterium]
MKKTVILLLLNLTFVFFAKEIIITPKDPKNPDNPKIINEENKTRDEEPEVSKSKINLEYKKQNGKGNKGVVENFKDFYLKLSWENNEYAEQEILIDFVKTIKIKGYTMIKKTKDKLSIVYYFPYLYDISLKDGKLITDAKGRINEIESFTVYNSMGKEKCYTYFIRYWLEDKQFFSDNKSNDYLESPEVPENVVILMNFN